MPRRRVLTDAQVEGVLALPVDEPLLVRHWILAGADLAAIEHRRGEHNQLGFALQLCAFRYPGRLLRPGDTIPEPALRFVAEQLRVSSDALTSYAGRAQTRREQLDALRAEFNFRMYAPGHGRELLAWLLPIALATTNAPAIAAALMDELRRRRIIAPGPSVIER
jgi:TnpA family transposase